MSQSKTKNYTSNKNYHQSKKNSKIDDEAANNVRVILNNHIMQEHNMPRDNPPPKPAKTIKRVVKDVSGDLPTPVKAQSQPATKKKPSAPRLTAAQIRQNAEDEKYRAKTKAYTKYCRHSIFHHASLCDEVSRMYNRIETVNEECSMLAKKLQKYERNKIRRLQTFYRRKEAAAKRGSPQISVTDEFSNPSFSAQ